MPTARILLADDNADMRDYVKRLLSQYWEVETVGNGFAALEAIAQRPPNLVLSDVMMPGLDGFGLLGELRSDPATQNIPVILLSARAGEEARIEGLEAGADDYLMKPFSARELLARVEAILKLAQIRKQAETAIREGEERGKAILNGDGSLQKLIGTTIDITERKQAEEAIHQSQVLYQTLAEAMPHLVWTLSLDGKVEYVNQQFGAVLGITTEQLNQAGWSLTVHPDDLPLALENWGNMLANGVQSSIKTRVRVADGTYRWFLHQAVPIRNPQGQVLQWIGTSTDIDALKCTENTLRENEVQLQQATERFERAAAP